MIIMPSTPRLSTPARSATSSPAAASRSGVEAASTARMMASTSPMCGLMVGSHEAAALEQQRHGGDRIELGGGREVIALGIAPGAADEIVEKQIRDIDQHQAG